MGFMAPNIGAIAKPLPPDPDQSPEAKARIEEERRRAMLAARNAKGREASILTGGLAKPLDAQSVVRKTLLGGA